MLVKEVETSEREFRPIGIEIVLETEDELRDLFHRMNHDPDQIEKIYVHLEIDPTIYHYSFDNTDLSEALFDFLHNIMLREGIMP